MALNIKNPEVERLAAEVSAITGETKTEAVRKALDERRRRLALDAGARRPRGEAFLRYLQAEVWPKAPAQALGRRLSREEEDALLGFGPEGA